MTSHLPWSAGHLGGDWVAEVGVELLVSRMHKDGFGEEEEWTSLDGRRDDHLHVF